MREGAGIEKLVGQVRKDGAQRAGGLLQGTHSLYVWKQFHLTDEMSGAHPVVEPGLLVSKPTPAPPARGSHSGSSRKAWPHTPPRAAY